MRVRMKVELSGTHNNKAWPRRGELVEVGDQEGAELCAAGIAEPVVEPEPVEKAVASEPEKRTGRKRG